MFAAATQPALTTDTSLTTWIRVVAAMLSLLRSVALQACARRDNRSVRKTSNKVALLLQGMAAEIEDIQALVVSEETAKGADAINDARRQRGFAPLAVVTVKLVGGLDVASKLSSTALRQAGSCTDGAVGARRAMKRL